MRFEANVRTHSIVFFGGSLLTAMLIGSAIFRVAADLNQAQRATPAAVVATKPAPAAGADRAPALVFGATETDEITAPAELGTRSGLPRSEELLPRAPEAERDTQPLPMYERIIDEPFVAPSGEWPIRDETTWRSNYLDGRYQIELAGRSSLNLFRALPVEQCRISVDISVRGGGAGLVFLLNQSSNTLYRVLLGADGMYALQQQRGDDSVMLVDWTASDRLRADPDAIYQLTVERRAGDVAILIDGQPLTTWAVPDMTATQQYGLAITSRHGIAEASFDNLVVEVPITP